MSISEASPAVNRMKRTGFTPWSPAGGMAGRMAAAAAASSTKDVPSPEPARIVSDIPSQNAAPGETAAKGAGLATHPRVQAAQEAWEQTRQHMQKAGLGLRPSPPSSVSRGDAKSNARRLTEEMVAQKMEAISGRPQPGLAMPAGTGPSMSFSTGGELLQKIMNDNLAGKGTSSQGGKPPAGTPPAPPKDGDALTAIHYATDGRLYSQYPNPNGTQESGRGALIPAHYQHHDDPAYPVVCPVRDCRKLFKGIKGLGGHFGAGHMSTTYNDNLDGTLSKIGSYARSGPGHTPAIVISQHPPPADAPPCIEPSLSYQATMALKRAATNSNSPQPQSPSTAERRESPRSVPRPVSPAVSPAETQSDVKAYLHSFLVPSQYMFKREDVQVMAQLPRLRDLPNSWISYHKSTSLDLTHYTCALAYLTGKEVSGPTECQAHKRSVRPTSRLSTPCIEPPPLPPKTFAAVPTCVGCKYWSHLQRRQITCDWSGQEYIPRGRSAGQGRSGSRSPTSGAKPMEMEITESESEPASRAVGTEQQPQRKRRRLAQSPLPEQGSFAGAPQPLLSGADLEMEEWEVAPGRIRDDESSENVAFSNSYLTSGQPITVAEDVSFNVLVIKPGSTTHWSPDEDKLRTCSVAAGKVKVTMGEKVFQLGPNGMFVVRPGQTCKVENRLYVDSVVHCTTTAGFGQR